MITPFYRRLQVEVGFNWKLLPSGQMTWREWAFDPNGGATLPGQLLNRKNKPDQTVAAYIDFECPDKKMRSRFFWLHGAIRVLGFDIGGGIFYGQQPIQPVIAS
jgi:hypothetical protein